MFSFRYFQTTFSGGNILLEVSPKWGVFCKGGFKITTKVEGKWKLQRLLNLYGYMDCISGIWDKTSRDALKNLYKRESLKINHNGNWSVEVLQDLKRGNYIISNPITILLSFAEEIILSRGQNLFGFTAVESSEK